jgi:hypothetical protein
MNNRFIIGALLLISLAIASFSATPAKPYADLSDGDALTSAWLMGTFNTIYAWAQVADPKITRLVSGITPEGTYTASATSAVATTTLAINFDSTGLAYLVASGTGSWGFDATAQFVATDSTQFGRAFVRGTTALGASFSELVGGTYSEIQATPTAFIPELIPVVTHEKKIGFVASVPAGIECKLWVTLYPLIR